MSPEEKEAIIDKASELGFDWMGGSTWIYLAKDTILFFDEVSIFISVGLKQSESRLLKRLTSPEDLENLFNAITK